ncbi:MAG: nucleoside kinase [Acetatifactor sp.]|nr:nucleoside kinase [Acetatifactor sp.]
MVTLTIKGQQKTYEEGITYAKIAEEYQKDYEAPIALVSVNGKLRELFKRVSKDAEIEFYTLKDSVGYKTYVRTATMLLLKSIFDCFGSEAVNETRVEFTIGNGLFVKPYGFEATDENAAKIKARMKELQFRAVPFMKSSYPIDDAIELFSKIGMNDKVNLFKYRRSSSVNVYEVEGFYDYYYGYMLPNAGYVKWFDVINYGGGFVLVLPSAGEPEVIKPFVPREKLFKTLRDSENWATHVGMGNIGQLNDGICGDSLEEMILVHEAEQERKIGEIAKEIVARKGCKFVMIAGPSSSGKTSFSHRISIQLRTLGKVPHPIGLDNYYVDREKTPRGEDGEYNFECLEALDVDLFNRDMTKLLAGERVELPVFNFKTGKREYRGDFLQLGEDDILVIEGIHGLNEKMSSLIPAESKFKIYISCLTSVNIDNHNRIPTTDGRLLRRMVRDDRTRGTDARSTINMWASVRRGEENYIFPFQEEADAMFNSALIYELAVIKPFAERLLFDIPKKDPAYFEAKRLLKFLDYFLSIPSENLPNNSLCREFVGGSCFNV